MLKQLMLHQVPCFEQVFHQVWTASSEWEGEVAIIGVCPTKKDKRYFFGDWPRVVHNAYIYILISLP